MSALGIFSIQLGVVLMVLLLIQAYLWGGFILYIRRSAIRQTTKQVMQCAALLMFLYIGMTMVYMIGGRLPDGPLPQVVVYTIVYPFWIWILPSTLVFFPVCLIKDLIVVVIRGIARCRQHTQPLPLSGSYGHTLSRRRFLRIAATGAIAAPVGFTAYGSTLGAHRYEITRIPVIMHGLPEGLSGLRIVHVSDIHSNLYMDRASMDEIVTLINELPADLMVFTGDYVTGTERYIYPFIESFGSLRFPDYGVYATLGNHDAWTNPDEITAAIQTIGINVLRNTTSVIPVKDAHLNLIGIDYGSMKQGSRQRRGRRVSWPAIAGLLDEAEQTAHPDGFNILLSHNPWGFNLATQRGIPLTLSGHTHGGQIVLDLPGIRVSPASLFYPYVAGLYRHGSHALYVNRGCGTTGPPIRLNCTPEITILTLQNGEEKGRRG